MVTYKIERNIRRKHIALHVNNGEVIVKAPPRTCEHYIEQLVVGKKQWILKTLARQLEAAQNANDLRHGGVLWFRGKPFKLFIEHTGINKVNVNDETIVVEVKSKTHITRSYTIQKQLEQFFKQQANSYLLKRINYWSDKTGLIPDKVIVKKYKARWGSCNNYGLISLNYFLMMVPDSVIDYVLVHELCHLKHLNHSPRFWQLVNNHFPNYLTAKQWLKTHQRALTWPAAG